MEKIRIVLLFGGRSAEHEVSIHSAKNIAAALSRVKYELFPVYISRKGEWYYIDNIETIPPTGEPHPEDVYAQVFLKPQSGASILVRRRGSRVVASVDVVFPILHGPYGEDGTVQGMLRIFDLPFVGADVTGSAIGMDKDVMKRLLREAGVPVPRFLVYRRESRSGMKFADVKGELGLPLFVKPANLGSSVGISKVHGADDFDQAVEAAFRYDRKIIVEECVQGREIECSVLGNEQPIASLPGEIIPRREFYSYNAKYVDDRGADLVIPAKLGGKAVRKIQELAVQSFKVLCCEGMARVDFFIRENGKILVNEINTIPGFTNISMYPKLWVASGMPQEELVDRLVQLAFERYRREKRAGREG